MEGCQGTAGPFGLLDFWFLYFFNILEKTRTKMGGKESQLSQWALHTTAPRVLSGLL